MEEPKPTNPHQFNSSQVSLRFGYRLALLSAFAALGTHGFATTFAILLAVAAIFCATMGAMRRDPLLGPVLTYWDEAAAYAFIGHLVHEFSR
jgi:hypothetical protein